MTLPTEQEINPYPEDLDGREAVKHFLGKTVADIVQAFPAEGQSLQEDLMWMGPKAFCFYFPAALQYLRSDASRGDDVMVSALGAVIEHRLEHDGEDVREAWPAMLDLANRVIDHYDHYEVDASIFGDLRTRYQRITRALSGGDTA